jgi:hypothetical protein
MPWWAQLGLGFVATTGAFNWMFWLYWRPCLAGRFDQPAPTDAEEAS